MVDFRKRLGGKAAIRPVDPIEIYGTLDRAHDKGPLRPSQEAVLREWNVRQANTRDVIVKLHTGQGKTLVGLLMLQSRLNAGKGPVVYLCPDSFLIAQTREQAKQFGVRTCTAGSYDELPEEFLNSSCILVTSAQKLFNGLTKFGLNRASIEVDTVLMDDAHACADRIRAECRIRIPSNEPAYASLKTLFATDLEQQGVGTYADIENGKREALLPVPYWAWIERESEVASILSSQTDRKPVKFAWPLLRDMLAHCQCIVSGTAIEIEPYVPPLDAFGSYSRAAHRVFMSATVTDDSFLVKGLRLSPQTITTPLTYDRETWSGEKMIVIPSLIHEDLDHDRIVEIFGKPRGGGDALKQAPSALQFGRQAPTRTRRRFVRELVEGAGVVIDLHDDARGDVEAQRTCRRLNAEIRVANVTADRNPSACVARLSVKAERVLVVVAHVSVLCTVEA